MSEHESVAGALLAELEAGGELVDAGGFSIDAVQARAKLREFQLADPYEYVLLLIEAAVLAGAEPVRIRTGGGELTVSLGPLRVHREELEQLFAAAFVDLSGADPAERNRRRALQKLAFACNAALRLEPEAIEIAAVDGDSALCLRLTPERERGELEVTSAAGDDRSPGTVVKIHHRGLAQGLREIGLIRERCRFSNYKIELDGQLISVGHRFALHVELDPERPALSPNARNVRRIELDDRPIGCAGFRYTDSAPAELRILTNGVLAEQFELGDEQRPAAKNFGAIVELDLAKDLGQSKLLRGPEYERVIEAVWALHDSVTARRAVARRTSVPPQPRARASFSSVPALGVGVMVVGVVVGVVGSVALGGLLFGAGVLVVVLDHIGDGR